MSLKTFHIVFITLSSLLGFGFGAWSLHRASVQGDGTLRVLGSLSLVIGVALIVYGIWFVRKIRTREEEDRRRRNLMRPVSALAMLAVLATRDAAACTVCYGEAQGPMIDAARLGVWLLFGLVLLLQVSFAAFFVVLWKRSREHGTDGSVQRAGKGALDR